MQEITKIQSRVGGWEYTYYIKRMHYFPKKIFERLWSGLVISTVNYGEFLQYILSNLAEHLGVFH